MPLSSTVSLGFPYKYIGLYIEQLEQGELRVPFSTFFLAVIKHFGVHVSQLVPMGVNMRKVRKNQEPDRSGSEKTLSPTPLHHVVPENVKEPVIVTSTGLTGDASKVEKEVVDLSDASTPPTTAIQLSPQPERTASDALSFHFSGHEDTYDGSADHRFMPNLGLYEDLRICTHEHLNHDYVDLCNCSEAYLMELGRLRTSLQREMQANDGLTKRLALLDSAHYLCADRERELVDRLKDIKTERDDWRRTASDQERVRELEGEKAALKARLAQAEVDRQKLVREFIPVVVQRLHTSVECRKSLVAPVSLCFTAGWLGGLSMGQTGDQIAAMLFETQDLDIKGSKSWEGKHRELFTMQYPYIKKVTDSYRLPMDDLMEVSLDVPPPSTPPVNEAGTSAADRTDGAAQ
nr:hypothetical protein [Tanacetum cinerariifolium]